MRDHKTLLCWQLGRDLSEEIHRVTISNWKPPATAAFDQLRRASLSVRLNIAEGYALGSPGLFARHLTIAYGSAVETSELLEFFRETGLLGPTDVETLIQLASRIQALVLPLRKRYLLERSSHAVQKR